MPREMPDCALTLTWYFISGSCCFLVRDYKQSLFYRSIPQSRNNPRRPKSCSNARSDVPRRRGTEYIKETHSRSHFGDTVRKRARTHTRRSSTVIRPGTGNYMIMKCFWARPVHAARGRKHNTISPGEFNRPTRKARPERERETEKGRRRPA